MKFGDEPILTLSDSGRLRHAVKYAVLAGIAGMGWTPVVGAQEAAPAAGEGTEQLETIEVTGTRIRRVDLETASPVFVIDRESIEKSGVPTLGELLQDMPSIAGAATNPQVNNGGGGGAATVSLRGLSSDRTLLLLNGRRLITSDVNAIPINLVERVEVLKDGASSVYGSDAVAGVVNIITRKNFQGSEYAAAYGISSRDDNETGNAWLTMGLPSERGNLMFGLNYDDIAAVSSSDRDFSKNPWALYYGQQIVLGSSRTFPHRIRVPTPATAGITLDCDGDGNITEAVVVRRIDGTDGRQASDYRCFIGGGPGNDTYDFQDVNVNVTPQERFGTWLQGDYQVAQDVNFFTEVFYHNTKSNFQIAPEPYDNRASFANTPVTATNVFNPFGQDLTDVRVRLVDVGNRTEQFDTDRYQINAGFKGTGLGGMLENWQWEGYLTQGRIKQTSAANGELYTPAMLAALGPSFDNADNNPAADADGDGDPIDQPTCGTANTAATGAPPPAPTVVLNCIPVDFFGSISSDSVAAIAPEVHDRASST
ncbi:MAG: TonB-dependent receptor plug domain-containing protein, partial [Dongiaceae bacterium]